MRPSAAGGLTGAGSPLGGGEAVVQRGQECLAVGDERVEALALEGVGDVIDRHAQLAQPPHHVPRRRAPRARRAGARPAVLRDGEEGGLGMVLTVSGAIRSAT